VAPSLTSTDATADLVKNEAVMAAFVDRLPIGRAATPDEVAGVIAFLASEDAVFVKWGDFASRRRPTCVQRPTEFPFAIRLRGKNQIELSALE